MADTLGSVDIPPLQRECRSAARALQEFLIPQEVSPLVLSVLATEANLFDRVQASHAAGIAILQVYKLSFVGSIRYGTGVVVARLPSGRWSAPGAVMTYGAGIGPQAGVLSVSLLCLLNRGAVEALVRGDSVVVGSSAAVAVGTRGRSGEGVAELWQRDSPKAIILSYARASGLYGGLSFEGGVLQQRRDTNSAFYGKDVTLREILSGAIPPPYESLNFFYDVLARLDAPSSTGSINLVDDKGKAKEKSASKIERDASSTAPSLAAAAPSLSHTQHTLPPPSAFASKSHLHAELERLLNEPFDERKREEILEKIRSLPLSIPAQIHSEAPHPSAAQTPTHFPPEKPYKAKNEVYASQFDSDAPKSPISHHLVHPSTHPLGINEPPEIELHNDDNFSTIQASLQSQGIGANVNFDGNGNGMLEDCDEVFPGEGDGHGMFSHHHSEKQIDKSERKAERAEEALKDILGEVEKSAKVQINATAHKIHDVAVATKHKVVGVVEAVASKVGLAKGKDETSTFAHASASHSSTAPTPDTMSSITEALDSETVPIIVPHHTHSTAVHASAPPTEVSPTEPHEAIVTPLPSITEALATDTVPLSVIVSGPSPAHLETTPFGTVAPTDPAELPPADTGTITERLNRLDEDPGGFGMDIGRDTAPNPQDKKPLGKEEEHSTPVEPSTESKKGLLSKLVEKVEDMMPERAPPDAPNKPGAPMEYFEELHDRVLQEESSGSGANHPLGYDLSPVFDDDDEGMDTEIEIPSSYVTAASVLATLHTKVSSSFLPRAAAPEPKEWVDAALHMMQVKESAEREAAVTTTATSRDTSGSGSDIHEPEELPTKDVHAEKGLKKEEQVKEKEKGKGEAHEEEGHMEEEKREPEAKAEAPKPAKPGKKGVVEMGGVTIEETGPEEEEEPRVTMKPKEERPEEVLMLKEEEKERKQAPKREKMPKKEEALKIKEETLQKVPKPGEEVKKPSEVPREARPVPISSREPLGPEMRPGEFKAKQEPEGHKPHKTRAHKGKAKEGEIPVRRKSTEHKPGEGIAEKGKETSVPLKKRRGKKAAKKEEKQWQPKEQKAPEEAKPEPVREKTEAHEEEETFGEEGLEEEEEEEGEVIIGVIYAEVEPEEFGGLEEEFPEEMELLSDAIDREVEIIEGVLQRGDAFGLESPSRGDVDQGLLAQPRSDSLLNQFGEATTQQAKNLGEVLQGQPQRREPELIRPQTPQFGQPRHPPGAQQGFRAAPSTGAVPSSRPTAEPSAPFAQQGGLPEFGAQLPSPPPGGAQFSAQPSSSFGLQAGAGFGAQQQFPQGYHAPQFTPSFFAQQGLPGQQQPSSYPSQGLPAQPQAPPPHAGFGGLGMQPPSPLPTTSAFPRGITAAQEAEILRAKQEGGGVLREPQHDQLLELAETEARIEPPSTGRYQVPPSPADIHARGGIPFEEQVRRPHGGASLEEQEKELERKKSSIAAALDASTKEALHQIRVAEAERLQPREKVEEKPTVTTSAQVAPHLPHPVEVVVMQEPLPTPPSTADVAQQLEEARQLSREMAAKWAEASRLILEQAVAEADAINTQWKTMLAVKLQEAINRAEQGRIDLELHIREAERVLLERPEQLAELMRVKFTECLRLNQMAKLDVTRILLESATQGDVFEARIDEALRVKFGEANAIATNRIEAIRSAGEVATPLPRPQP